MQIPPKPDERPANPQFSSGPCTKRPGWRLDGLSDAFLGRSHRHAGGKAKLQAVIEGSRRVLGIPESWRVGIVPASDTGAVEMAMWSLLGPRGVDVLAWESFGASGRSTPASTSSSSTCACSKRLTAACRTLARSISNATSFSPGTARPRVCACRMAIGYPPNGPV